MRIITGIYKGRRFDIPHTFKARPTTDFAKENIFNVLNSYIDFEGTTALDLFAGTGSISLELLSRGCQQVVSIEKDRDHHAFIRQCVQKLGADNSVVIRGDVFRYIKSCSQQFDFIFADPPYQLTELAQIPDLIFEKDLLKEEGIFVLEHGAQNDFSNHPHFVEHRKYGSVNFSIFQ
ncbi:MAG: 16S rRNA (guanine(966)-N(2))-methyltransferase RsmD [Prevotella sp.]|nr:16S rRNA (guanine(966)-N(2))-methyltransferase RsmD [Prevotella sp.]